MLPVHMVRTKAFPLHCIHQRIAKPLIKRDVLFTPGIQVYPVGLLIAFAEPMHLMNYRKTYLEAQLQNGWAAEDSTKS